MISDSCELGLYEVARAIKQYSKIQGLMTLINAPLLTHNQKKKYCKELEKEIGIGDA